MTMGRREQRGNTTCAAEWNDENPVLRDPASWRWSWVCHHAAPRGGNLARTCRLHELQWTVLVVPVSGMC